MLRTWYIRSFVLGLMVVLTASFSSSACLADMYGFDQITQNGNTPVASQLTVEVTDAGTDLTNGINQVLFKFTNTGGIASSICDVYFDDGTLFGIALITDSGDGVSFANPATPGDLPGGNLATPPFKTTGQFSADSTSPTEDNGVNNTSSGTEWVGITFDLINGQTFADTIAALADGSLRMGLHVQSIGQDGGSESFVSVVPAPGAVLLGLLGLGAAGLKLRHMV